MLQHTPLRVSLLFALGLFMTGVAHTAAQPPEGGSPGERPPPHGPPPAAFAACDNQEAGTLCEFEGRRGTVNGTCRTPRGDRLVCVPNHHRGGRGGERPRGERPER